MSETLPNVTSEKIETPILSYLQTTTRGNGDLILSDESFSRDSIDYSRVLSHLSIHTEGLVAGSQFSSELFYSSQAVIEFMKNILPEKLQYDQFGRAEITVSLNGLIVGYSGVKPVTELESIDIEIDLARSPRIEGGLRDEVDGVIGSWFPEEVFDQEAKRPLVRLTKQGQIYNPRGKFVPDSIIAHVDGEQIEQTMATEKATIIIQKNPDTELPTVLTIFPGENAPAGPVIIDSESYKINTLHDKLATEFWDTHAFIKYK